MTGGQADKLVRKAKAARAAGDNLAAAELYRQLTVLRPEDPVLWHNLAAALGDAGQHVRALDAAQRAEALGLHAPEAFMVRARSLQAVGDLDAAEKAFRFVLARRPFDAAAHKDLAQLRWMVTGSAEEAVAALLPAFQKAPGDLGLRITAADILGQLGRKTEAAGVARESIRLAPQDPVVLTRAAATFLDAGLVDEARDTAAQALKLAPRAKDARTLEVQCLLAGGGYEDALPRAEHLYAAYPEDQFLRALVATALRLLGDPRYHELVDYHRCVRGYPLEAPPGWSSAESYRQDLLAELSERHRFTAHPFGQSVKGASSQLASMPGAGGRAMAAWPDAVLGPVKAHLQRMGERPPPDDKLRQRLEVWSVRLLPSGHHTDHVHPAGLLSSACHLKFDEQPGPHGWLRFGRPGLKLKDPLEEDYIVRPEPGVLVAFPSSYWHGVAPFEKGSERITVAMDLARPRR